MKKDVSFIILFSVLGLLLAFLVGAPLLKDEPQAQVGTPLDQAPIYAEGIISAAPELEEQTRDMAALFIIARAAAAGPPLAVRRYDFPSLPLKYTLTQDHNMLSDDFYTGEITLIAQLDSDGAAGRQPQDFEGRAVLHEGGSRRVDILITE